MVAQLIRQIAIQKFYLKIRLNQLLTPQFLQTKLQDLILRHIIIT